MPQRSARTIYTTNPQNNKYIIHVILLYMGVGTPRKVVRNTHARATDILPSRELYSEICYLSDFQPPYPQGSPIPQRLKDISLEYFGLQGQSRTCQYNAHIFPGTGRRSAPGTRGMRWCPSVYNVIVGMFLIGPGGPNIPICPWCIRWFTTLRTSLPSREILVSLPEASNSHTTQNYTQ